jgi:hypothetical protein
MRIVGSGVGVGREVKENIKEEQEGVGSARSRRRKRIRIFHTVKTIVLDMCRQQTRR